MGTTKLKPGDLYEGPKSIATVDDVTAHYVLNEDGSLGERLVQIDLAPGNPDEHVEEFRVAAKDDPVQTTAANVELEVEAIGEATSGV